MLQVLQIIVKINVCLLLLKATHLMYRERKQDISQATEHRVDLSGLML